MFYLLGNKLLSLMSDDSRTRKVLIIGTLCYIILHVYLFARYNENAEMITKYRNYIYLMFAADLIYTGYLLTQIKKSDAHDTAKVENKKDTDDEEDGEEEEEDTEEKVDTVDNKEIKEIKSDKKQKSPFATKHKDDETEDNRVHRP